MRTIVLLLVCLCVLPAAARAQAWHAPMFMPPEAGDELGFYVIDPESADWGVVGSWRQTGNLNLGLRGGVIDQRDELLVPLGVEFFGTLARASAAMPLSIGWLGGVGATLGGGGTLVSIPLGISAGLRLGGQGFLLIPYLTPRVSLEFFTDDDNDDNESDLLFSTDIGADLHLGNTLVLRLGASVGDWDAVGFGVVFPAGRRVVVR